MQSGKIVYVIKSQSFIKVCMNDLWRQFSSTICQSIEQTNFNCFAKIYYYLNKITKINTKNMPHLSEKQKCLQL